MGVGNTVGRSFLSVVMNFVRTIDPTWLHPGMDEWTPTLNHLREHEEPTIRDTAADLIDRWTKTGSLQSEPASESSALDCQTAPQSQETPSLPIPQPTDKPSPTETQTRTSTEINVEEMTLMDNSFLQTDTLGVTEAHVSSIDGEPGVNPGLSEIRSGVIDRPKLDVGDFSQQLPASDRSSSMIQGSTPDRNSVVRSGHRVEGLLAPLPRAFRSPSSTAVVSTKRRTSSNKRVHWAPEETLITIRYFREADPPSRWREGYHVMQPVVGWIRPTPIDIDTAWMVRRGEESQEKLNQSARQDRVAAIRSNALAGDFDPEEPYPIDAFPDPLQQTTTIPLYHIKKQTKQPLKSTPRPKLPTSSPSQVHQVSSDGVLVGGTVVVHQGMMQPPVYLGGSVFQTGSAYVAPQQVYFVPGNCAGLNMNGNVQYSNSEKRWSG